MRSNTIGNVNSGNQNDMFHQGSGCMNFCNLRTKDAHAQTYLQKKKTHKWGEQLQQVKENCYSFRGYLIKFLEVFVHCKLVV